MPDSRSTDIPLVFISHKHVDRQIAQVLADFINEESRGEVEVHNSSNSNYLGPVGGERLTDALRRVLWRTDVLLLIYTAADQDWSFCMWEAGVATDSASPNTRTVVLQCGDEVAPVFQGFVRVDLRNRDDVRKFVIEFFLDAGYFPRRNRGLTPRWKRESVQHAADQLHAALSKVIQPANSSFSHLWPCIRLRVDRGTASVVRSHSMDRIDRAACRVAISEGAMVSGQFQGAIDLFGMADFKGKSFAQMLANWNQASGQADTAWHESCCDQILDVLLSASPVVRQEELMRPGSEITFTPALTRWKKGDDSEFEFEFIDMSNPRGIAVDTRMLPLAAIKSKLLEDAQQTSLTELSEKLDDQQICRLPILDAKSRLLFVVHKSVIDGFLVALLRKNEKEKQINNVFLGDLLKEPVLTGLITAAAFVPIDSTMADARLAMINKERCQDVFVTEHGQADEPILGWLTNNDFRRSGANTH